MGETVARETQVDAILVLLQKARDMGWGKVEAEVTRGGTVRVVAEDGPGAKVVKPAFTSGLRK